MSFYRQYRPQTLTELVGQAHVRQTFLNALKKNGLVHAYLFAGPRGTGKTSTARIIARALNCEKPTAAGEPCNECTLCKAALDNRLVDLIEIDAASNRGIDEMRDLKEKIIFAPSQAKNKIYIIDEVHMLTTPAFNALLKTLEEPPAHAYFILATTEAHKVPETILSRCQRFDFHRISDTEIAAHLKSIAAKEKIQTDEKALLAIAKQSAGGLRDALGLLEQLGIGGEITMDSVGVALGLSSPVAVDDFVHALLYGQVAAALAAIDGLVGEGANLVQFNKAVLNKLREVLLERVAADKIGEAKGILRVVAEFTRAGEDLKNAIIPQLPLEVAAIAVCGAGVETISPESKTMNTTEHKRLTKLAEEKETQPEVKKKLESEKKVETEKAVQPEVKAAIDPKLKTADTMSVETVQKALPVVIGKLKKAALKMALKDITITKVENNKITLGVSSDFVLAKLDTPEAKDLIATAFSTVLKMDVMIICERSEVELASAAPTRSATAVGGLASPKKTTAEVATELFADGQEW